MIAMRSSAPRSPISQAQLHTLCALDETGERALEMAVQRMNLSAASYESTELLPIRMAEHVSTKHLAEAVQFRNLDRNYWS
jgi:magnesium chelatase family protein